jgi:hypothetical protein
MARKTARSDDERLDDNSLERVIAYLQEKGATKKVACQILNISYNTSRLDKLIETYKQKKENDARRRAEKRGKPATKEEVSFIVSEYLEGNTLDSISKSLYRGTSFIKNILDAYAVPERNSSPDYFKPRLIPDEAVRTEFKENEIVYSARYDTLAKIIKEVPHKLGKVYQIWLKGEWQQYAYQPAWELASLQKLREEGIML